MILQNKLINSYLLFPITIIVLTIILLVIIIKIIQIIITIPTTIIITD